MNQSDPSTLQTLHSTPTVQLTFSELFNIFIFFSCAILKNFTTTDGHETVKTGRRPRTNGNQEGGPGGPTTLGTRRIWPATPFVHGAWRPFTPRLTGATADG